MPLPFTLPYEGTSPSFETAPLHAGPGAAVLGRATIGRNAWLGAGAVIRADGHYVKIGDDFRIGARGTVHISHEVHPTNVGNGVTAGHNSIIHACEVGDRCHIGHGAIILDGSKLGAGSALADGSIVFPRTELEGGWLYEGVPAKPVRRLAEAELEALHAASRATADLSSTSPDASAARIEAGAGLFVAATVRIAGRLAAGPGLGVWFSTRLDAGRHAIRIGDSTNIQDNSIVTARDGDVTIGSHVTFGHNVTATDVTVGSNTLVGMGSVLAPGTVVGDNVLIAAGTRTVAGQHLASGRFHSGNPAVDRGPIDDRKRMIVEGAWRHYLVYAEAFNREQAARPTAG